MNKTARTIAMLLLAVAAAEFALIGARAAGIVDARDVRRGLPALPPVALRSAAPQNAGPPASIELTPDPATCGSTLQTVRARITDDRGRRVADGTPVHFISPYGTVDPMQAVTDKGEAETAFTPYPYYQLGDSDLADVPVPSSQYATVPQTSPIFAPTVFVNVGTLQAAIGVHCAPPPPAPCGPNDPPVSPPCPPSPPPRDPVPGSPPCATPTPVPGCAGIPTSPPCPPPSPPECPISPPAVSPPCFPPPPPPTPPPSDCSISPPPASSPPCPEPVATMTVGSGKAPIGQTASVTIELKDVPLPGIVGYGFQVVYDDISLSRTAGTTNICMFGMGGVPPAATGPSPYGGGCVNLPAPGDYDLDCSPGPCTLATIVFVCDQAGTFPLTLDVLTGGTTYVDERLISLPVFTVNGSITCGSPTARNGTSLHL